MTVNTKRAEGDGPNRLFVWCTGAASRECTCRNDHHILWGGSEQKCEEEKRHCLGMIQIQTMNVRRLPSLLTLLLALSGTGCGADEVPQPGEAPRPNAGPHPPMGSPEHPPAHGQPGSGAALQDPTGFPPFHAWPAPSGPPVPAGGSWSAPVQLTSKPTGGYRPQLAVGAGDLLHALFYDRTDGGDIIRHRTSRGGETWTPPVRLGHTKDRNWGPDLVARSDGSIVVVYDHALQDFSSQGFVTTWKAGTWSEPAALTPGGSGEEVGSGHVAHGVGDTLAYVFIGKKMSPAHHFQARYRWHQDGVWSETRPLTDGKVDAWHTNVERRPDGTMLAGWDVGMGGSETQVYVAEVRGGGLGKPENISASSHPGERVHFAFGPDGRDHLAWFHKERSRPVHIYTRSGRPGAWGPPQEPSQGYGGYHFDPDIAVNPAGVRCLVWGWDSGTEAELVYSLDRGSGWSSPRRVAQVRWGKPGLPSLDVDSQGRFHVVWNQGIRGYNEVYYAQIEVR